MDKLIDLLEVRQHFIVGGVTPSRSYIEGLVKKGVLPKPGRIGKKLAWYESSVIEAKKNVMNPS